MGVVRVACRRHDWTNALFDGRATAPSIELTVTEQANVGVDGLLADDARFEYAECGLSGLIVARAKGAPVVALPVFIRNAFRQSYIFVRDDAGISTPKDLEGKRIGTRYNMTATVWARGFLQHDYGVRLERVHWVNDEPAEAAGGYRLPKGLALEPVAAGADLQGLLLDGKIDGLIHAAVDVDRLLAGGGVRRLFADAGGEERAWWARTHIVPMMNVLACREDIVRDRPDELREVFAAFVRAKELGMAAQHNNRDSGLFWFWETFEEQGRLMGPDPVPYSVGGNRHAIETLLHYCAEQGIGDRELGVGELFVESLDG